MIKSFILSLAVCLFAAKLSYSQVVLVDFGATASGNQFGLTGWNTVIKSANTDYTASGPGGLVMVSGSDNLAAYQGITGPAREFKRGERIAVTWYNKGTTAITMSGHRSMPLVSFTDSNNPVDNDNEPQWYPMSRSDNLFGYSISINPGQSLVSVYDITENTVCGGRVAASAGTHSIVNVCPRNTSQDLVCDKIELIAADTMPPTQPQDIAAQSMSSSHINVTWQASSDNVAVDKYKIYVDGVFHGISRTTSYAVYNLIPSTEYEITVTAIDGFRNECEKPAVVRETTQPLAGNLLHPRALEYKGAFRFPSNSSMHNSSWEYRKNPDPAYYPRTTGDPSPNDGYPGSIFTAGHIYQNYLAEIDIPEPVISASINDLHRAAVIQDFHDVKSSNIPNAQLRWGVAAEYLPAQAGQVTDKLYLIFGEDYNVSNTRRADKGACELDLSTPNPQGGWYVGTSADHPPENVTYKYIFSIPEAWAEDHTGGRMLVLGGSRYGNYPNGPSMYAIAPWIDGSSLPSANAELSFVTLLQYEDNNGTHYLNGQEMSGLDSWQGGAWLTTGSRSAVIVIGTKVFGETWYGFSNGAPDGGGVPNSAYPDLFVPDPGEWEGHGPKCTLTKPMILFYDPTDLQNVAHGVKETYEPQPYAALPDVKGATIAYDSERDIIYTIDDDADAGNPLGYIYKIDSAYVGIETSQHEAVNKQAIEVYPNPFNPATTITISNYELQITDEIKIFNVSGKLVKDLTPDIRNLKLVIHNSVVWDASAQPSGLYVIRIHAGDRVVSKAITLLK